MSISDIEIVSLRNEIHKANDNSELVKTLFERRTAGRIYNPLENAAATEELKEQIAEWQYDNAAVVMVFGCFDAPFHSNHQRFLLDCKLQGVEKYYNRLSEGGVLDVPWQQLDIESKQGFSQAVLADGAVKLVVSIDGDKRVAASKGFVPGKGNSARPLQSWETRADNVLGLSLQLDERQGFRSPVVDAVTIHDHHALPGTIHANTLDMIAEFRPDVWTLYHEAKDDIIAASADSRLFDIDIVVIEDERGYDALDPRTGRPFSTTDLVRRVKGDL